MAWGERIESIAGSITDSIANLIACQKSKLPLGNTYRGLEDRD